jgi:RimK-like ATP-grasp domain
MLILLWGLPSEGPMAAVYRELRALGVPVLLVDQSNTVETIVELDVDESVSGRIHTSQGDFDLADVTAAYLRPYDPRALFPDEASDSLPQALLADHILSTWSELTSALVINPLASMASNNSKPYQLQLIRDAGFLVPDTLITTDPQAAEQFWLRHRNVIYKSLSATRSQVSRLGPLHRDRLLDVVSCPTQFQQHIPGRDHRVHVIGSRIFASELVCDADDYRYPGAHPLEIRPADIPAEIQEMCYAIARSLRLPLAGVDLRRTPDGDWYCFEVNPSPAFTYYENATGQPMARTVARLLCSSGDCDEIASVHLEHSEPIASILTPPGVVQPVPWNL